MADLIKINKKCINDPLYTPVDRFLKERIAKLEIEGPADELELARERYTSLVAGDLVIENPVAFPDGITRVCFTARKTGFARVDVDIKRVGMKDILDDFAVPFIEIQDPENLKEYVKANPTEAALLWCVWLDNWGVLLNQESAKTINGPMKAFGELFFNVYSMSRESLTYIDYDTLESGKLDITDASFGSGQYPVFIYELVLDEANIPGITSNLPETITTQRGKDFSIPNTYWFNTTQDITHTATVELTTGSGYTIPKRSDDGNFIVGETIFGSENKEVNDTILVRVTHMYNGRPVKKTFVIKVVIEKDAEFDLTFVVTPPTLEAPSGSDVEFKIAAFYKGAQVKIAVPPNELKADPSFGTLAFAGWDTDDLTMIYSGKLSTSFKPDEEKKGALYSEMFLYNDGGATETAPAYVNVVLIPATAGPQFEIRGLTSSVVGYKGDTGEIEVSAFYGDDPIPATELSIRPGVVGDEGLIELTGVTPTGITYVLLKDSGIPGEPISDSWLQTFRWISPTGVRYTRQNRIGVTVKRISVYSVTPRYPDPYLVERYNTGWIPFIFTLNGEDRTRDIAGYEFVDPKGIIKPMQGSWGSWVVTEAPKDPEPNNTTTAKTKFRFSIDGVWKDFEYDQNFEIKAWKEPGPEEPKENTVVVAVPSSVSIGGVNNETGEFEFRVFQEGVDITSTAIVVDDKTVVPEHITFDEISYVEDTNVIRVKYTKLLPTVSTGKIYVIRPGVVGEPKPEDTGVVSISANVKQSRVLLLTDYARDTNIEVAKPAELANVYLSFAGERILLTDPQLETEYLTRDTKVKVQGVEDTGILVFNNTWTAIGTYIQEYIPVKYTYADPLDPLNVSSVSLNLPVRTTFPPMRIEGDVEEIINTKIWETDTLPFKLFAGDTDWTSAITFIRATESQRYISFSKLNWEVVWADKEELTLPLELEIGWAVGETKDQKFIKPVTYHLEAWDQITFKGVWNPTSIEQDSRTNGKITATFTYKGVEATKDVILDKTRSTIPETMILGVGSQVEGEGLVVGYETTKGGIHDMTLAYVHKSGSTINAVIPTDIKWPKELNLVNIGTNIRGYWKSEQQFTLEYNYEGIPVPLDDPKMVITATSGTGEPVKLETIGEKSLTFLLEKGGEKGTEYKYNVTINVLYTDADGKEWPEKHVIPATIIVPDVMIGNNPVYSVKVWDHGRFTLTLRDTSGKNVPIDAIVPLGTNPYVSFVEPDSWYVIDGNTSRPITTQVMLMLSYQMGGNNYTMDVETEFNIERYDGKKFVVETDSELRLEGPAGTGGVLKFDYLYAGAPITDVTLDMGTSVIPANISLGELSPTGELPYTFSGQATDKMKLVFLRPNAPIPPVENMDKVTFNFDVITTSTDEPFILESSDSELELNWRETGEIKLSFKYGVYPVAPNAPGMRYQLSDTASKAVTIAGATKTGLRVTAKKGGTANSVILYPEDFIVTYDVGAPTPKRQTWSTGVTIKTGDAVINNNDLTTGKLWDTGAFSQNVMMGDQVLNTILRYEVLVGSKYIEFKAPRGWEIVDAQKEVDTDVTLSMRLFYAVESTTTEQTLDFDAQFKVLKRGDSGGGGEEVVKFECQVSPANIDGGVDVESILRVRPLYKDKPVGGQAIFKQNLSTFPDSLTLKSVKVEGEYYVLTLLGVEPGLGEIHLEFWSPEAGATPTEDHIWKGVVATKVLGELGLEIGQRDNLLVGQHNQTGTYNMEILFAGIPLDAAEEIKAGRLRVTVEAATEGNDNAGVLTITSWGEKSFEYKLTGPLAPGQTIDVSDFLNMSYSYGGTSYSRRVEVPEQYTTSDVTITPNVYNVKMFQKGVVSVNVMCDGVSLTAGFQQAVDASAQPNGYVTINLKAFEVVNADVDAKQVVFPIRYSGNYRRWTWSGEADTTWNIAAWSQKTFTGTWMGGNPAVPIPSLSYNGVVGASGASMDAQFQFKDVISYTGQDIIDYLETDLHGAIEIGNVGPIGSGDASQRTRWAFDPVGEYKGPIKFIFRRPGGAKPGVEFLDWVSLTMDVDIKMEPLRVLPYATANGGSGDATAFAVKVYLGAKLIPLDDPNLSMVMDPDDIVEITYTGSESYNAKMLIPLDYPHGIVDVKLKYTYVDPVTGNTHLGEGIQKFNIGNPNDYPRLGGIGGKKVVLWEVGGTAPIGLTVVSGPANTNITAQCSPVKWESTAPASGTWIDLPEAPNAGNNWWQVVSGPKTGSNVRLDHKVTIKAPFRETFVELVATIYFVMDAVGTVYELAGTAAPNPFELIANKDTVIRFKMTYRGKPTTNVILNEAESLFSQFGEEKFSIKSVVTDGNDMVVTVTGLVTTAGSFIFCWDVKDVAEPVLGKTRITMGVSAYAGLTITPVPQTVKIWQSYDLSATVVSSPGTDLRKELTIVAVSDKRIKPLAKSSTLPARFQVIAAPEVGETVDITYTVKISDIYGGGTVDVVVPTTFEAWDQIQFKATLKPENPNWVLFKEGDKDVISVPDTGETRSYGITFTTVVWNEQSPNGTNGTAGTIVNDLRGSGGLAKWSSGGGGPTGATMRFYPIKQGEHDGFQEVTYYQANGVSQPNGYPQGTLGKNRENYPLIWEVFYPAPSFRDGVEPDTIVVPATNGTSVVPMPLDMVFGRLPVELDVTAYANVVVKPNPVAEYWNSAADLNKTRVYFKPLFVNTGPDDVETTIPITVRYLYRLAPEKWYEVDYDYPVIFKGTPGAPEPVVEVVSIVEPTVDVWQKNTTYPFSVQVDGVNVPLTATNVTAVSVDTNEYIQQGTFTEGWKAIKGTEEGITVPVTWKFTFFHNLRSYELTATTNVVINPYDGVELKVTLLNPSAFNNGIISRVSQSTGYNFQVELRGKILDNAGTRPYSLWVTKTNSTMIKGSNLTTTQPYVYTGMLGLVDGLVSEDTDWYVGLTAKETDVNAVEGVDFVKLTIPTYCYNTERFYPVTWTKELKGTVGQAMNWNYTMRKGITPINMTSSGFGTGLADFGAGNQELAVNGADWWRNPNYLQLKFANVIPVGEKVTPTVFTLGPQSVHVSLHAKFTDINLVQVSTVEHPIATATTEEVTARIKDSGDVPFHVTWKGDDVTSQVSAVRVQSNSYVEMRDGKWYVKFAEIANTTVLPVFELDIRLENVLFTLKLPIKFNILGWNGKEIVATADPLLLGIGERGLINIKGNYSGAPLPGNVTFDKANSDGAGMVTFGAMNVTEDNQLAIVVTGDTAGRGEVKVQLRSVHDTGNSNPGSDFLDITVPTEVIPANLTPITDFAETGEGSRFVPAVLKQAVLLGEDQLDNNDPGLAIELLNSDVLTIESLGTNTITYNFSEPTSVPVARTAQLKFTYKGRSEYVVDITVTQNPVEARPVITNLTPMTVEYGKSYATPFKVEVAQ